MHAVTIHRPALSICLAVMLVAALPATGSLCASAAPPPQPPIRYTMTVDVDYEKPSLSVVQDIQVPNRSSVPLSTLLFNVPPAAFNAFALTSVAVGGNTVTHVQDAVLLEIPLPQPLLPGQVVTATLRWWGRLPASNGRYGASDGILVLGDWYPILAVLAPDGVWERHQYTPIGDAFFSDVADYDVTVNVPANVTVAASGVLVARQGGRWQFRAQNARDFAFAVSDRFQTTSRKVDQVTITVYHTAERAEAAKTSLTIAEQAMRWYAKRIGPYPFPNLAIVQAPPGGEHTAQEHAGLFFLRSEIFTTQTVGIYVAHELAHAWFFAAVGNDQIREPWMDEALATSVSLDFYRDMYPREYPAHWAVWGGTPEDFRKLPPMNRGIMDFKPDGLYFRTVYQQGAGFFKAVREAMGDDAYWAALQQYYAEFSYRIARPQDLLRILRGAAKTDLLPIFREFLDYPYLKYAHLSVTVGGPDASVWEGVTSVPITVTADSPTYTLSVFLDANVVTRTNSAVTVTIDTHTLADGEHTILAIADDGGINRSEARRVFRVQKPTPTPTVTPTATPTATAAPVVTRMPSPTSSALPTATQSTSPDTPGQTTPAAPLQALVAVLVAIAVFVAVVMILRPKRRRW